MEGYLRRKENTSLRPVSWPLYHAERCSSCVVIVIHFSLSVKQYAQAAVCPGRTLPLPEQCPPAGVSGRTEFDPVGQLPALGLHRAGRLPGAYPTGALSGVWSDPQSVARFSASLPALRVEPAVPGGLAVLDGRLGLRTLSPPLAPIRAGALNGASLDQRLCLWRGLSVSRCLEPISAERAS